MSYKTGTQFPYLLELSREVHRAGALFVVDATQALGHVPVTVEGVDFLVASSYKWLLGVHGLGLVYCAPRLLDELAPGVRPAGTPSPIRLHLTASSGLHCKMEPRASPVECRTFPRSYVMRESLGFLIQLGIERIDLQLKPLVKKLREGIASLGFSC